MMELKIFRAERRLASKLTTLDISRTHLAFSRTAWKSSHGIRPWKEQKAQKSWLVFKEQLLQAQKISIPMNRKLGKSVKRRDWMNEDLLSKLRHKKGSTARVEVRMSNLGGIKKQKHIVQSSMDKARKAITQMEFNLHKDGKDKPVSTQVTKDRLGKMWAHC